MATVNMSDKESRNTSGAGLVPTEATNIDLYIEDYSIWIKLTFVLVGMASLVASTLALVILSRARKIPQSAKYLSKWLLVFDVLYISFSCLRKFIYDPGLNLNLQVLAQILVQGSYLTICVMAVERLVALQRPNAYLKYCTKPTLRKIMILVFLTDFMIFYLLRYVGCYFKHNSFIYLTQAGLCNSIMYYHYIILLVLILVISTFCYYKIFRIVQTKVGPNKQKLSLLGTFKMINGYKLTSISLVYLFVIALTTLAFLLVLMLRAVGALGVTELRWAIEIVALVNCVLDPYLYVMWFRENKMQLVKLACPCSARARRKVEAMRMEIFCIVTSERTKKFSPTCDNVVSIC